MNEKKYTYCTFGLILVTLLAVFLPRIPLIRSFINRCPFDPLPIFWCVVALTIFFFLPWVHVPGRLRLKKQIWGMAISGAVIFLALRFGTGALLHSIAESPYNHSPQGIFMNLFGILPAVIAREMIRSYTLGVAYRKPPYSRIWIPVITLVMCLTEINFSKMAVLKSNEEWFIYVAQDVLPVISQSCLLTVLNLSGGASAGMIYSGILGSFTRIFPFLPSLPWLGESALGITIPIITTLLTWEWFKTYILGQTKRRQEKIGLFTAQLTCTVIFAWFMVGVFPIYPSVILTGSMEPGIFPGDIVLIQKFSKEEEIYSLAENDVINFRREDITITHRIVEVIYDPDGNVAFQTKGDNNRNVDSTIVEPADLNGIIKRVVPKVGIPVLWMQRNEPLPEGVVDY